MSSYYTTAQLEAMRKERIRQELAESVRSLQNQIRTGEENKVQVSLGAHITVSVSIPDEVQTGLSAGTAVSEGALTSAEKQPAEQKNELDFSSLLSAPGKKRTRLESELDEWIQKADERPILTEKDAHDRDRLLSEISRITSDVSMDIADQIIQVKLRVNAYLQSAVRLTAADEEQIRNRYCEYCALCELAGIQPREVLPYKVESEIARLTEVLRKQREDEYIMEVISAIMEDLGCHVREEAVLDHTMGQVYSVDNHPLCDVFVGRDGNGIMFEPVAEAGMESLEMQRNTERSANHICSLYAVLEERAAEKGVILKRVYMEPADIHAMCTQSALSGRRQAQKKRKSSGTRLRSLQSEV